MSDAPVEPIASPEEPERSEPISISAAQEPSPTTPVAESPAVSSLSSLASSPASRVSGSDERNGSVRSVPNGTSVSAEDDAGEAEQQTSAVSEEEAAVAAVPAVTSASTPVASTVVPAVTSTYTPVASPAAPAVTTASTPVASTVVPAVSAASTPVASTPTAAESLVSPGRRARSRAASEHLSHNPDTESTEERKAIELTEVKGQVEVTGTTSPVGPDPTPQPEQQNEPAEEDTQLDASAQPGYGTFDEPPRPASPTETRRSQSASPTDNEEAAFLPRAASHSPDLSNWMVFANLMKASLGTGILAMPMAFRNAGSLAGPLLFGVIAAACIYCIRLLVESSRTLRRRLHFPTLEYADTAGYACSTSESLFIQSLAPYVRYFTEIFLVAYMIGACSVYVLFVKENLKQLIDVACKENEWSSLDYLLHLALVLVVLVAIPNLSSLSVVSLIANITMILGVGMCLALVGHQIEYHDLAPQLQYNRTMDTWSNVSVYNVTTELWVGWDRMPLFFGTAVFALEGIGVVLTLENHMKDPASFLPLCCGVMPTAMILIAIMYGVMGLMGYLAYGETTKGSITLNLPPDSTLAFWVRKLVTLAIFLTYPLQFYIPEDILWNWLSKMTKACLRMGPAQNVAEWLQKCEAIRQVPRFIFKVLLMLATVALPLAVPRLGPAISLVGAVCLSMLGMILPTIIYVITHWPTIRSEMGTWQRRFKTVVHVVIVVVGVAGLVTGTYVSIRELNEEAIPITTAAE